MTNSAKSLKKLCKYEPRNKFEEITLKSLIEICEKRVETQNQSLSILYDEILNDENLVFGGQQAAQESYNHLLSINVVTNEIESYFQKIKKFDLQLG